MKEGKDKFHIRTFWFKFCSSSFVSSPSERVCPQSASPWWGERWKRGVGVEPPPPAAPLEAKGISLVQHDAVNYTVCFYIHEHLLTPGLFVICLWSERSNHQSHFLQTQMLQRMQKSVLYVGMKTNWKLFILPPTSPESMFVFCTEAESCNEPASCRLCHTVWTRCAARQRRREKVKPESVWLQQHQELFQILDFWYLTNWISVYWTW